MLRLLMAAMVAMAAAPTHAALLEYKYTFKDGKTINGTFYGSLSADNTVFNATGSRFYSRSIYSGVLGGSTTVNRVNSKNAGQIALDKSYIDLSIQRTSATFPAVLFGFGQDSSGKDAYIRRGLGYDAVSNEDIGSYESFDASKLFIGVMREATLGFSYMKSGGSDIVTGIMSGWVSQDGTRFEVGGLNSLNGKDVSTELYLQSNDGLSPVVFMDKTKVDLSFSSSVSNPYPRDGTYLAINEGTYSSAANSEGDVFASENLGGARYFYSGFNAANLTLQLNGAVGAVPEPATWAMMIVGFVVVAATMRRNRTKVRFVTA